MRAKSSPAADGNATPPSCSRHAGVKILSSRASARCVRSVSVMAAILHPRRPDALACRRMHRLPTEDDTQAFWRDGAIVLRGALDRDEVAGMVPHVEALCGRTELVDMTAMGDALGRSGASVLREQVSRSEPKA